MDIARAIRLELDDDEQANLKTIMEATGERTAKKAVRKALRLYVSLRKKQRHLANGARVGLIEEGNQHPRRIQTQATETLSRWRFQDSGQHAVDVGLRNVLQVRHALIDFRRRLVKARG